MTDAKPFNTKEITPDNFEGWVTAIKKPLPIKALQLHFPEGFAVETLEGVMTGQPGDYLVIGTQGERYIIKREIFEATYEVQ